MASSSDQAAEGDSARLRQEIARLQALLDKSNKSVSSRMVKIFKECTANMVKAYEKRVREKEQEETKYAGEEREERLLLRGQRRTTRKIKRLGNRTWAVRAMNVVSRYANVKGSTRQRDEEIAKRCEREFTELGIKIDTY